MLSTRTLLALLATGVSVAACSSSSNGGASGTGGTGDTAPAVQSTSGAAAGGNNGVRQGVGAPAASGEIAAISGTTMQVQNQQSGQVAVAWTSKTTFSHTVTVRASAIKVGACVTAIAASGTAQDATLFPATTVVVTAARNGSCTGGFRPGAGGSRPSGAPSGFPGGGRSGFPGGRNFPSGVPSGARRSGARAAAFGTIASGKVTATNGSTLTIAATNFGSSATTTKTVTLGANTKITTAAATTSRSLKVGKCVTAQGKADSSGTVTATRIQITDPSGGQCSTGFFRPGGGTGG